MHEPEFSVATIIMAPVSVVLLLGLVNLNFSFFSSVFLKLRKIHLPKDNFGVKTVTTFG